MKSLRDSFIPPQSAIETFHYPVYVIQLQKERPIQAKRKNLHEKICTKTMSQPINIELFNKNIENLRLRFIKVEKIVNPMTSIFEILRKKTKTCKKGANMKKSRIFYEKWLYQEKRPFEENETVMKSKLFFNR